ncbi:MAG: HNH endonuclease [Candidatus Thermoplasmatota archaeon]|nr:HNH endonuclease [Candidatus Thermoplasmatota archaeon]
MGKPETEFPSITSIGVKGRFILMARQRGKGKPLEEPCAICGEMRWTDVAHFPRRKRDGARDEGTVFLCPTHHKLLDSGRISRKEFEVLMNSEKFRGNSSSVEEFVEWAHEEGYPYALSDLRDKFWDYKG